MNVKKSQFNIFFKNQPLTSGLIGPSYPDDSMTVLELMKLETDD